MGKIRLAIRPLDIGFVLSVKDTMEHKVASMMGCNPRRGSKRACLSNQAGHKEPAQPMIYLLSRELSQLCAWLMNLSHLSSISAYIMPFR